MTTTEVPDFAPTIMTDIQLADYVDDLAVDTGAVSTYLLGRGLPEADIAATTICLTAEASRNHGAYAYRTATAYVSLLPFLGRPTLRAAQRNKHVDEYSTVVSDRSSKTLTHELEHRIQHSMLDTPLNELNAAYRRQLFDAAHAHFGNRLGSATLLAANEAIAANILPQPTIQSCASLALVATGASLVAYGIAWKRDLVRANYYGNPLEIEARQAADRHTQPWLSVQFRQG